MKDYPKKNRIIVLIFVIFILLFIGEFFLLRSYQKDKQIESNKENLQMLANEKATQVNNFLELKEEELKIIGSMNVFKEAVLYPNDSSKLETAKKRIDELKGTVPGISVLTNEGIAVIGEIDLPETDYSQHPYFVAKRQDMTFTNYYCPIRKKDYYAIIGPLHDNSEKLIGRIAFDIELDKIGEIMKKTIDGEINEVYIINENGLLLSSSEYLSKDSKNGVLIQEVKSDGAKVCLEDLKKFGKESSDEESFDEEDSVEEHEEEVISYTNYMGNEVFGAHAYVPEIMGCIIAEESKEEVTRFSLTGYVTGNVIGKFNKKEVKNEE